MVRATHLVRAVADRLTRRVSYQRYAVTLEGTRLRGDIETTVDDIRLPRRGLSSPKIPAGHVALVDRFGALVGFVLPLPVATTQTVDVTIISNATDTAALLIPTAGALATTEHTFRFDLDRARYRSTVADDDSNDRSTVTWQLIP